MNQALDPDTPDVDARIDRIMPDYAGLDIYGEKPFTWGLAQGAH